MTVEHEVSKAHGFFGRLWRIEVSLECYRAHLVRHCNQRLFQSFMLGQQPGLCRFGAVFVVDGSWVKQQEQLRWAALCEGCEGNKATSMFGRVSTLFNLDTNVRAQHRDVDWTTYPAASEDGGPEFVRVSIRAFSDSSTQSANYTVMTRTALNCVLFREIPPQLHRHARRRRAVRWGE